MCGHIYCLDCATFHFSQADPFCAVCRKPQTLENMIRLYTDTDDGFTRDDASAMGEDDQLSLSPVSVRSIERAGEDAAGAVKKAIAGRADMDEALVACNTFVNSVTPRERAHINEELLRDIAFQLTLVQRVLKDNEVQVTRLKEEVQTARAAETKARLRIDQQRRLLKRAEKEQVEAVKGLAAQQERYDILYQQCIVATEDATRTRVRAAKAVNEFEEMEQEMKEWRERAAKVTKKYYALKSELKQLKQAAQGQPHRSRARSDDLEVV
ncbi:uncharacterized protein TRAVEDRAFT_67585 [Trametes versicolor FP-101664 SS1]|uniref:RING-type domain-containing protein n=1 Tax=Trametes versicolor (strain FP-101664) TaxID=717944 RepID=R7S9Y5_TRAVS|nr:uncharacterized protein TRAVEDRAFT_67585 [Trametes versicolor FP-101664 SS1]EIW51759.1 hypothetical protein TRAVEDRAFT_67585 [Trametes versicolor FP-101664 SS1]